LIYNDGPNDKPGPDKKAWVKYLGRYEWKQYGEIGGTFSIHRKNGFLYFDNLKLSEFKPGLFFSSTGEVLDLRSKTPTWRNIKLKKL
jgi:hypothetical protein